MFFNKLTKYLLLLPILNPNHPHEACFGVTFVQKVKQGFDALLGIDGRLKDVEERRHATVGREELARAADRMASELETAKRHYSR